MFSFTRIDLVHASIGDVIHLSALGQSIIILNSARSIYDLLERRSALYSDRPSTVMAGEL